MRRLLFALAIAIITCANFIFAPLSQTKASSPQDTSRNNNGKRSAAGKPGQPSLIVMIAVDQLRGDLLERYRTAFTGGFKRLLDQGLRFSRATVDHAPTNSYPGHVTLATGAFPGRHGIIDNSWAERVGNRLAYVGGADDPDEQIVGFPKLRGVSPRKLLVTGLADWVLQADPQAQVVNIGAGEYSSLLHAGKTRSHTYWFSPEAGRYVTSTYYRGAYPEWVERFNKETLPRYMAQKVWDNSVPLKDRALALPDKAAYEFDGVHTTFPHLFQNEVSKEQLNDAAAFADWFYFSPMLDASAFALTREAVGSLSLGKRGHTDYLSLVLSSTDSIGHRYGPISLEQLDNLLRLDKELGEFFGFLDREVGEGRYTVALSADHGAAEVPEYQKEMGKNGRRITEKDMDALLGDLKEAIANPSESPQERSRRAAVLAEKYDFIADAMTSDELSGGKPGSMFMELYRNSFYPGRTPVYPIVSRKYPSLAVYDIRVRLAEGAVPYFAPSNHGSPYFYDRNVALIFMGPGIRKGVSTARARTVDVAPTLAQLGNIAVPARVDGRSLSGALRKR